MINNNMSNSNESPHEPINSLTHSQLITLLRSILDASNDGIVVVDKQGRVVDYNQKFADIWHIPQSIIDSKDEKIIFEYVYQQLESNVDYFIGIRSLIKPLDVAHVDVLKFKDERVFERYSSPYKLKNEIVGRIWQFHDITKYIKLEKELEHQATHDTLTQLPNKALLFDRINQSISLANANGSTFAVFVLDIHRFKLINESFSHLVGDVLLRVISNRLQHILKPGDTLAREGSDEFIIVAAHNKNENVILKAANAFLDIFKHPYKTLDRELMLAGNIGISIYPRDGDNADELLRHAEIAVSRCKEGGVNRAEFYTTIMNGQSLARLDKEAQLRQAISEGQLFLHYQPQINLKTGELVGVEALVRWQHPQLGLINPLNFIPLAEETGLIIPMGEWILKTACQQAKKWQQSGFPRIRMAVNISETQIKKSNLIETIQKVLLETKLAPQYLELEINENVIINNHNIIAIITGLKDMGIEITLDDFGTGYSSISNLKKVPLNRIKIDYAFMQNIPGNKDDNEIVRAIIAMGNAFGLDVMAEGIEKEKQIEFLKNENCAGVQGFYYSYPLSREELEIFFLDRQNTV